MISSHAARWRDLLLLRQAPVEHAREHARAHAHVAAEHQVVEHGQAAEQGDVLEGARDAERGDVARLLLGDVAAFEHDAAGVGLVEAGDHVQQRGLAGAVGADDGEDAAAWHVERHVLHGGDAAETLGHALDHKLVVALSRGHALGGRPHHEPSLNHRLTFPYSWRHHAGSDGRRQQICLSSGHHPGDRDMPRHIVCLTFDHDHLSGFIARGLTTPTAISRGEYDVVVIPAPRGAAGALRHQGDLLHARPHDRQHARRR